MRKRYLIKNVELVEVSPHATNPEVHIEPGEEAITENFIAPNGDIYYLAIPEKVSKVLMLPLNSFKSMSDVIGSLTLENKLMLDKKISAENKLSKYKNMTFWKRLKFLFGGTPC